MMESSCERWAELSDRMALDEVLSDQEVRFLREHGYACATCATEARLWDSLAASLDGGESLRPSSNSDGAVEFSGGEKRRSQKRRAVVVAALGLAAAAAVTLFSIFSELDGSTQPTETTSRASGARVNLAMVSGDVQVGGAQASAGSALRPGDVLSVKRGRACLTYGWDTSACVNEGTRLRLPPTDSQERRLRLEEGRVVCLLDERASGARFSIETSRATITATGTLFAVEMLPDDGVGVRLHRGSLEITVGENTRKLHAPIAVIVGKGFEELSHGGKEWQDDEDLIRAAELWADGAVAPLDVTTTPEGARVVVNGTPLGQTPLSMLVKRGKHQLLVQQEGFAAYREEFVVVGAERVSKTPKLRVMQVDQGTVTVPREAPKTTPPGPSSAEMLERARQLRRRGDFAEALEWYKKLLRRYPKSAEASVALLSQAELQLSQLGQPRAALQSFERYSKTGGPLLQEALYGRIRALRAVGRNREARVAALDFIRRYPASPQAQSLKETLGD